MVSFFIAALVGVGVGVLSGLLGIGGGTVMVPLFRLAFGMEPIAATATSLFTIVPTSISGMWKHAKNKTSLPRVGIVCGLTGACLSPVGVWAANVSPGWAIMGAAAVVVMYSSFTMLKKALAAPKGGAAKGSRKVCEKKSTTSDTAAMGAAGATGDAAAASLAATAPVAAGGSSAAGAQAAPLEAPGNQAHPQIRGEGGAHRCCCRLHERICGRGRRFHYGAAIREHARNSHALGVGHVAYRGVYSGDSRRY